MKDSNFQPLPYKGSTLPIELIKHILVGMAGLEPAVFCSQSRRINQTFPHPVVRIRGFEPLTPPSQTVCSTKLSYILFIVFLVFGRGIEPRSANWKYADLAVSRPEHIIHLLWWFLVIWFLRNLLLSPLRKLISKFRHLIHLNELIFSYPLSQLPLITQELYQFLLFQLLVLISQDELL